MAERLKVCKETLMPEIALILNHIVERRDFPQCWSVGIRSAIHKAGIRSNVDNYKGVTILPIMEKGFETAVYRGVCHS